VSDLSGRELLSEWRKAMDSALASAASLGGSAMPRHLLEPMQRQLELVQEVIERERRAQRQLAGHLLAPVDAVFDVLEESGTMLRHQAEALETAGRALEDTARLVNTQAELFERAIGTLREPSERARTGWGTGAEHRATVATSRACPSARPRGGPGSLREAAAHGAVRVVPAKTWLASAWGSAARAWPC
jgi:hypothetical protein